LSVFIIRSTDGTGCWNLAQGWMFGSSSVASSHDLYWRTNCRYPSINTGKLNTFGTSSPFSYKNLKTNRYSTLYWVHCIVALTQIKTNKSHIIKQVLKVISEECVALAQLCNKGPIGYNGTPQIHPPKCPFLFDDHHPHLIHSSLDWPHSPSKTASWSNWPFCHSTLSRQTDRQTDWDRRSRWHIHNMSAPLAMLINSDTLTIKQLQISSFTIYYYYE